MANRSWMPSSTDTSGSGDAPGPEGAVGNAFVRFEVVAVGDRILPRQRASGADVVETVEVGLAPADPDDTGPQDGHQPRIARAVFRIGEERPDAVGLLALDVEQKHVGRVFRDLDRKLRQQARLERPDADDEERAEADGEQDHARLVARARQVQHRMAKRKRRRPGERRDHGDQHPAGRLQHDGEPGKAAAHDRPDAQRAGLPAGDADQRQPDERHDRHLRVQSRATPRRLVAQEQRGLDVADLHQRHDGEQQRHEQPDRDALRGGAPRQAVVGFRQDRRRAAERERDAPRAWRAPGTRPAGCRPSPSASTCRM